MALVSIEDLEHLKALEDKLDILESVLAKKKIAKKGMTSLKSLLKELGLKDSL